MVLILRKTLFCLTTIAIVSLVHSEISYCQPLNNQHLIKGNYANQDFSKAQDFKQALKRVYGVNQLLVNGRNYDRYRKNLIGHPFIFSDKFVPGSITYRGIKFENVMLNYDVNKDKVVVWHFHGTEQQLFFCPPNEFITEFELEDKKFIRRKVKNRPTSFYQELYTGKLKCYYHWRKNERDVLENHTVYKEFLDLRVRMYIEYGAGEHEFLGKRGFIKAFPEEKQKAIRSLLKREKIHLKKSKIEDIAYLMSECDKILHP